MVKVTEIVRIQDLKRHTRMIRSEARRLRDHLEAKGIPFGALGEREVQRAFHTISLMMMYNTETVKYENPFRETAEYKLCGGNGND